MRDGARLATAGPEEKILSPERAPSSEPGNPRGIAVLMAAPWVCSSHR